MNIKELKKTIENLPDDMEIAIWNGGSTYMTGIELKTKDLWQHNNEATYLTFNWPSDLIGKIALDK